VSRTPAPHLAFGYGVHHCLGAALARQEMTVAFPALLRRFPRLALDVAFDDVAYRANAVFYGPSTLPVTW
jgi:cytochrome P450